MLRSFFQGYYNNQKATDESMDSEGFVKTGDIGYIKQNGFVYVVDRKKDIFKYKGDHITPSEIESVIEKMEQVEFVTVVGIPDAETYNLPAAVIKKKKGFQQLTEDEVIKFVADRLPDYKQLHGGVYFVDEMPMTKNDKILKREALKIAVEIFKGKQNKK